MRSRRRDHGRAPVLRPGGDFRSRGMEDGAQLAGSRSRATLAAARTPARPTRVRGEDIPDMATHQADCSRRPRLPGEGGTALGRVQDEDACRGVPVRRGRAVGSAVGHRGEYGGARERNRLCSRPGSTAQASVRTQGTALAKSGSHRLGETTRSHSRGSRRSKVRELTRALRPMRLPRRVQTESTRSRIAWLRPRSRLEALGLPGRTASRHYRLSACCRRIARVRPTWWRSAERRGQA